MIYPTELAMFSAVRTHPHASRGDLTFAAYRLHGSKREFAYEKTLWLGALDRLEKMGWISRCKNGTYTPTKEGLQEVGAYYENFLVPLVAGYQRWTR